MEQYAQNQSAQPAKPNLRHAGLGKRIIAYIIDAILIGLVLGIVYAALIFGGVFTFGFSPMSTGDTSLYSGFLRRGTLVLQGLSFLLVLLYFTYFESREGGGATIGKRILDIRVVDQMNRKVDMSKSFIRNILRAIWSIPCIGFLILILDIVLIATRDQRIGDIGANTYVVKK